MKRIQYKGLRAASSIFALFLVLSAAGCAGNSESPTAQETTIATSPASLQTSDGAKLSEPADGAAQTDPTVKPVNGSSEPVSGTATPISTMEKEPGLSSETTGESSSAQEDPSSETQLPSLRVTYQDGTAFAEIPSASGGFTIITPQPDGTVQSLIACGADPLTELAKSTEEIPYLEYGGQMILSFENGSQPDSVELTDIILKKDGTSQYDERTYIHTTLECIDGKAEFTLEENPVVLLSSTINPEGFYRGFHVNCTWENGSAAEYAFMFRVGNCFPIESSPETSDVLSPQT